MEVKFGESDNKYWREYGLVHILIHASRALMGSGNLKLFLHYLVILIQYVI